MKTSSAVDKLGVSLSAICAVHCALTALAIAVFPMLSPLADSETPVHFILACFLLVITALAFVRGFQQHRQFGIVLLAAAGLALVFAAFFAHGFETDSHRSMEALITTAGSVLLIFAHFRNLRSMSCCKDPASTAADRPARKSPSCLGSPRRKIA